MDQEEKRAEDSAIQSYGKVVTGGIQTLLIAGQIEGHAQLPPPAKATRFEHFVPQLALAEGDPEVKGVLFLINTVGGDVEAGLAMAEMISGMTKPSVSLVLGGGHSIGIPLAVAAKRSIIAPSATMTVHPVRVNGLVLGAPQSFEYLMGMQERILDFVVRHSRISAQRLSELMQGRSDMATDLGTILGAKAAVDEGLMDEVGSFSRALALLRESF